MSLKEKLQIDPEKIVPKLTALIKEKTENLKRDGVIFGLSGGVDSAVICALCVKAVEKEKCLALLMPEKDSAKETKKDAEMVAKHFSVKTHFEDISPKLAQFGIYKLLPGRHLPKRWKEKAVPKFYEYYQKKTGKTVFETGLLGTKDNPYQKWLDRSAAYYRIKHRLRMINMYYQAELRNLLYVSSANNTEWLTGFFVKWGVDGVGDVAPLLPFYKTQVWKLAHALKIPKNITEKTPSPDIMPGITDEYALGISYEKLDLVLVGLEQKMTSHDIAKEALVDEKTVEYVRELNRSSGHMREVFVPTL